MRRPKHRVREHLTIVHRWTGLVIAGFLVLAGLTGSMLAWLDELEVLLNPELHRVQAPGPDAKPLDPLVLRELVERLYPGTQAPTVWLATKPGRSHTFFLMGAPDPATGSLRELPNDQIFLNPYTGEVVGERRWGDIGQGIKNLMPFVYRLHYSLALGTLGQFILGIVALFWTLDCIVGAWLTFPSRRPPQAGGKFWLARWRPAWSLRWNAGGYRLYDLHRAGGLWPWAMLFVLAWSSVAFNLEEVYHPVMRSVFASQFDARENSAGARVPDLPVLGFHEAREAARRHMAEQARIHGFAVHGEDWMFYDAGRRLYRYDVASSRDVNAHNGNTRLHIDADTGALRGLWLPTGAAGADTIYTWLTSLHMAALWGWPMKLFVCLMGVAVTLLSATGVIIWARKRAARRLNSARSSGSADSSAGQPC